MKRSVFIFIALVATCATSLGDDRDAEQLFVRRILPLLHEKCIACHGGDPENVEGSLDLTTERGALKGGDSEEPAIVRQHPEQSPLLLAVSRQSDDWSAMPPKEAEKLTDEQIEWIREWLAAGVDFGPLAHPSCWYAQ